MQGACLAELSAFQFHAHSATGDVLLRIALLTHLLPNWNFFFGKGAVSTCD